LFSKKDISTGCGGPYVISAPQEVGIKVWGQPRQKFSEIPVATNKVDGLVVGGLWSERWGKRL
jgi:hypothetical protein